MAGLAAEYAAKAGLHRTHDGRVDVLRSAGGIQGIAESIAPGLVFLVAFTVTRELTLSLVAALAAAAVFTVVRLVQRKPLTQALAGVVGVGISAWLANTTGKAEDFYLPGFFTNAGYILAMVLSIFLKWPVAGLLFGFIRNEGLDWRKDPARVKAYQLGTWIIVAVLALRLAVQVPLYLMGPDGLAALATTRLIMGAPLYILGVWIAWLVTRPAPAQPAPESQPKDGPAAAD
jgi:FtsH-binding integral membrane protein